MLFQKENGASIQGGPAKIKPTYTYIHTF